MTRRTAQGGPGRRDRPEGGPRWFAAFDLPAPLRQALADQGTRVAEELPPARWVRPERLHLTLCFYGEVRDGQPLRRALQRAFAAAEPLTLQLEAAGTFPSRSRGRVAWVGVVPSPDLLALQGLVERASAEALDRTPDERPFHPHITLARPRRPWRRPAIETFTGAFAEHPLPERGSFPIHQGVLYESRLGAQAGREPYRVLETFPLAGD